MLYMFWFHAGPTDSGSVLTKSGSMLAQCWLNAGSMLAQCWLNAGSMQYGKFNW